VDRLKSNYNTRDYLLSETFNKYSISSSSAISLEKLTYL